MADQQHFVVRGGKTSVAVPEETLGQYLLGRLAVHGELVAQIDSGNGAQRSFAQLHREALAMAGGLQSQLGVREGDVVMVSCTNRGEFMVVTLAALYIGAVLAPVNPAFDHGDLSHLLSLLEPKVVFCEPSSEILPTLVEGIPLVKFDSPEFDTLLHCAPGQPGQPRNRVGSDTVFIMCSSGTTGTPKGVTISQDNMHWQLLSFRESGVDAWESNVKMIVTPPYWVTCVVLQLLGADMGYRVVLLRSFSAAGFMSTVESYKVQFVMLGPDHLVQVALYSGTPRDTSSLHHVMYGGAAMSQEMHQLAEQKLAVRIPQVYGMTEMLFALSNVGTGFEDNKATTGRPFANLAVKVIDLDTGKPLGPNQEGELCFRGPTVMAGYYKNSKATAETIDSEGWLHSGDVGYYNKDGCFFVLDRIKSLIKFRGVHVPPAEMEGALLSHPAVQEAAVVGVHHDTDQKRAVGCVVLRPGASASPEELVQHVAGKLPVLKQLHGGVRIIDCLPKTASGKVKRRELRTLVK